MRILDLNGPWQLFQPDRNLKLNAEVPGQVQTDLLRAGIIADPYYRDREAEQLWIGQSTWEYSREFEADPALLAEREVRLVCEGLDTVARIWINEICVGESANQFRACEFPVKPHLRAGRNSIRIQFQSPVPYASEKAARYPHPLPCVDFTGRNEHRNFIRKSQADFGWDWGPSLQPVGIWRPLRLEACSEARLTSVVCWQQPQANGDVNLRMRVWLDSPQGAQGRLEAEIAGTQVAQFIHVEPGENSVEMEWSVSAPARWWPRGYGDQVLYALRICFQGDGGEQQERDLRIGFRTVELVREPDAAGESFYFKVNGVPVFIKGANWIPADAFQARVTRSRLEDLLGSARDAHCNLLRVWGGGVYESEDFYNLCDEYGLLVWQDFMFACGLYPADDEFLRAVANEARFQIRRLAAHACLALWCGNNENEQALPGAFWEMPQLREALTQEYRRLYLDTLATEMSREAPGSLYWPSSPSNGPDAWGEPNEPGGETRTPGTFGVKHSISKIMGMCFRALFPNSDSSPALRKPPGNPCWLRRIWIFMLPCFCGISAAISGTAPLKRRWKLGSNRPGIFHRLFT